MGPTRSRKEQKRSHTLRYVLKNRKTDTVYLVVLFTLFLKEDVNEDGSIKVCKISQVTLFLGNICLAKHNRKVLKAANY